MSGESVTSWLTNNGDVVEVYWSREPGAVTEPRWRYRVRAGNQKIVEQGSEGYTRRHAAVKAARRHHPVVVEP
jgi:hypothetical protein